jgi:hypothetical protein
MPATPDVVPRTIRLLWLSVHPRKFTYELIKVLRKASARTAAQFGMMTFTCAQPATSAACELKKPNV